MVRTPIKKPIIIFDTREKQPWNWECDDAFDGVEYYALRSGDYSIKGMEDIIAIERKASVDELYTNFTKDKVRIAAEFERLKDHRLKFIIIEETFEDIMNPVKYYVNKKGINKSSPKMPMAVVTANLTRLMIEQGVHVIFAGTRAQAAARGILLQAYELHRKGKLIES